MEELERVVVGIDGSEPGRTALRWALAEAKLRGAALEVLHAWHVPRMVVPKEYDEGLVEMGRMREVALQLIDRELAAVGADGAAVLIEQSEAQHSAARALVEASRRAQLVVLGRHGEGGFLHELISPKVVQVAHHARCPVVVVPDAWEEGAGGVVVGVDGSEHAAAALRWAAAESRARTTPVTAVLAWGLLDQHHADAHDGDFDPRYGEAQARAALESYVKAAVIEDSGAVALRAVNDLPARALIEAAAGTELLVVGARGLGGFRELLLGSVSHRCLTHSTVPTVVVRA